jgi:hypothetical protein
MKQVPVHKLKGVTPELKTKLHKHRIHHHEHLFNRALTQSKREELAPKLGIHHTHLLELANRADLARIKGVAGVYSDLLEESGVDTVKELAVRKAENLHAKILQVNTEKHLTKAPPTLKMVESWITAAKRRRKFLQY